MSVPASNVVADRFGMPAAIGAAAALTTAAGLVALRRMRETLVRT
jgi:hypothetical protein